MRIMSAIHPSQNQKAVLAKIAAAPTPKVAGEQISRGENLVSARNMLMKLGMVTFANGEAQLTQQGQKIAQEENIVDQSGQLTELGQKLAFGDQPQPQQAAPQPPMDAAAPPAQGEPTLEQFSLLKQLLR